MRQVHGQAGKSIHSSGPVTVTRIGRILVIPGQICGNEGRIEAKLGSESEGEGSVRPMPRLRLGTGTSPIQLRQAPMVQGWCYKESLVHEQGCGWGPHVRLVRASEACWCAQALRIPHSFTRK